MPTNEGSRPTRYWVSRVEYTRVGKTWWATVRIPRMWGCKWLPCVVCSGAGRTRKAATAECMREARKRLSYRVALGRDLVAYASSAFCTFIGTKMREGGILRRIFLLVEVDRRGRELVNALAGRDPRTDRHAPNRHRARGRGLGAGSRHSGAGGRV